MDNTSNSHNSDSSSSRKQHQNSSNLLYKYFNILPSDKIILNKYYKNLLFFSKKILEAKYSITPELYNSILLNNLIVKKRSHYLAYLNEIAINTNILKEQLKRFYIYEESKTRVPKYVSYYQNYLKFFCKPIFTDYFMNRKMVKHMEKVAQIFYNENYADEEDNNSKENKNQKCNFKIFSKTINNEIDNCANFTKEEKDDNNYNNNNKILDFFKKNKNNNDKDNDFYNKDNDKNNNKLQFRNNDLDLLENIYKITPIIDINKNKNISKENKNENISYNNYDEDTKNTEIDSYQKILNEITYKKKTVKNKENLFKKSPLFNHNSSVFDYFNGLSMMLFAKKKKGFINKNNSLNNKFKKREKTSNNNNKIINNININIKHLTIGQKTLNPLSEINNLYNNNCLSKKSKKRIAKSRKHNSMILKDKSFKNYITGNLTSKNFEYKKRNDSFNIFHPKKAIIGYNSNYKKISNINTNSNSLITNTRNKSKLKGGTPGKINIGYVTSMNKNKKNCYIKKEIGKMTIYTNNSIQNNNNYIKNMLNITNSSNSKIIKDINNKSINLNNINNNNKNNKVRNNISSITLYKNSLAMISPQLFTKKYKYSNISLNKGITPMSFEKVRTTSHQSSQKNLGVINYNSPKNSLNNKIGYKNKNNSNSHANLRSPINIKNPVNLRKYNSILLKRKNKDEQQNDSKVVNLKFKNYVKFNAFKKNLKNKNKKHQSYNKGNKNNNEKKKKE